MGREGRGLPGEEAQEEEGRHRGAGESAQVPRTGDQVCHHPKVAGRQTAGGFFAPSLFSEFWESYSSVCRFRGLCAGDCRCGCVVPRYLECF